MSRRRRLPAYFVVAAVLIVVGVILYARLIETEHPVSVHSTGQTSR